MDFTFDAEQVAFKDSLRQLLSRKASDSPGLWSELADMGVLGLPFDGADGGVESGAAEIMLAAQELGRTLHRVPFIETVVVAGQLLLDAGHKRPLIPKICAGESTVVLAHLEPGGRWNTEARLVRAEATDDEWLLTGIKEPVPYGGHADQFIVSAHTGTRTALFLVDAASQGIERSSSTSHDGSQMARLSLHNTPAVRLDADNASELLVRAEVRAIAAVAAEALGAMEVLLQMTVDYLKTRKQFGVPLKSFQALTHRAADMFVAVELTRSMVQYAAMCLDANEFDPTGTSRLKLQISRAARLVGQEAIQLHGGIGMTSELPVGHYVSRLEVIEHSWGDGREHLKRLSATPGVGLELLR